MGDSSRRNEWCRTREYNGQMTVGVKRPRPETRARDSSSQDTYDGCGGALMLRGARRDSYAFEGVTVERSSGMCAPLNSGWLLLCSGLARCGLIGLGPIVGGLHWMGRGCGWRRKGDLMGNRSLLYMCTYRSHGCKEWAIAPRSCSHPWAPSIPVGHEPTMPPCKPFTEI